MGAQKGKDLLLKFNGGAGFVVELPAAGTGERAGHLARKAVGAAR
jgi:hypothetical protein